MASISISSYSIAKKIIRHLSHISFLRSCRRLKIIPNGLRATNILANTTNSSSAESLALKHSRQWLQLALDTQYQQLARIRAFVFPLNYSDDQQLTKLKNTLKERKDQKLERLLNNQRRQPELTEQPEQFKNLSSETLDPKLVKILNKGPSFVNAEPKHLPRQCLVARASLQAVTDKLKDQGVSDPAINELKGGIARVINECEQLGTDILRSKKLSYKRPSAEVTITRTDKTKRLVALDTSKYQEMVRNSTIASGNYDMKKRINLPRTEQIRFNGALSKIANKYRTRSS